MRMAISDSGIKMGGNLVLWLFFGLAVLIILAVVNKINLEADVFSLLSKFMDTLTSRLSFLERI